MTRGGTAELVSRDQFDRDANGKSKRNIFPVQLTKSRISEHAWLTYTLPAAKKVLTILAHKNT